MDEIARISDRIIVFSHGKIAMDGTPAEIFTEAERLMAIGLDVPHATELAMALEKEGLPLPRGIYTHEQLMDALLRLREGAPC